SLTVTLNVRAVLIAGEPSSVTRTVRVKVFGPWASVGVQVNMPVTGSIPAPAGAPGSRLKVNALAGRSGSGAAAVKESSVCSSTALSAMAASVGARFISATVTVIVSVALRAGVPLSVTRTVTANVPGPWASVGVQVNAPV